MKSNQQHAFDVKADLNEKFTEVHQKIEDLNLSPEYHRLGTTMLQYVFAEMHRRGWRHKLETKTEVKGNTFHISGKLHFELNGKKQGQKEFDAAISAIVMEANQYDSTNSEN